MLRHAFAALAAAVIVAGCSGGGTATHPSTSKLPVPTSALDALLLSPADINAVMGTTAITPSEPFRQMRDHSNLMTNLNCLGIWEIGEKDVYGQSDFAGVRGQVLREPDSDDWNSLVIQGVVSYLSAGAAQKFYGDSADRWSKCTNHRVNVTYTGHPQATWNFGPLTKTDTELTMPVNWTGDGGRSCQRALAVDNNVIVDAEACGQTIGDQAHTIVDKIRSRIAASA